jgi:hypothetical protein
MRSAVGAVCILDFAVRDDEGFFFPFLLAETGFTVVVGFFACVVFAECAEVVDLGLED